MYLRCAKPNSDTYGNARGGAVASLTDDTCMYVCMYTRDLSVTRTHPTPRCTLLAPPRQGCSVRRSEPAPHSAAGAWHPEEKGEEKKERKGSAAKPHQRSNFGQRQRVDSCTRWLSGSLAPRLACFMVRPTFAHGCGGKPGPRCSSDI